MTHRDFISSVEGYYGEFKMPLVKTLVMKHIMQYSENQLEAIFESLTLNFLKTYKPEIDVGAIAQAAEKAKVGMRIEGQEAMYDGRYLGNFDSGRFIPAIFLLDEKERIEYSKNYKDYTSPEKFMPLVAKSEQRMLAQREQQAIESGS